MFFDVFFFSSFERETKSLEAFFGSSKLKQILTSAAQSQQHLGSLATEKKEKKLFFLNLGQKRNFGTD
jgi:hypothetical protein